MRCVPKIVQFQECRRVPHPRVIVGSGRLGVDSSRAMHKHMCHMTEVY
jgi:hypothetical protein